MATRRECSRGVVSSTTETVVLLLPMLWFAAMDGESSPSSSASQFSKVAMDGNEWRMLTQLAPATPATLLLVLLSACWR